jgi:hypothetical protein
MELMLNYTEVGMKQGKSPFNFTLKQRKDSKALQDLNKGDILKSKNKEVFYEYDYLIEDDRGPFVYFKCPYGFGAILVRKKGLTGHFEMRHNSFVLYEKVKNTA